jgi:4-hydroxy-3-polyprenylbenzoate decarboxylase
MESRRIIVGITGATGIIYGVRLLDALRDLEIETHLIVSETAKSMAEFELGISATDLQARASFSYGNDQMYAPMSSGSFVTMGMVIAPCTVKTLSAVANSYNDTLIARAADAVLKERRKLVLMVRETPLHLGHLRLMAQVTEYGAVVLPPMPSFYHDPKTIEDLVDHTVGKILDQFQLEHNLYRRWSGGADAS